MWTEGGVAGFTLIALISQLQHYNTSKANDNCRNLCCYASELATLSILSKTVATGTFYSSQVVFVQGSRSTFFCQILSIQH